MVKVVDKQTLDLSKRDHEFKPAHRLWVPNQVEIVLRNGKWHGSHLSFLLKKKKVTCVYICKKRILMG